MSARKVVALAGYLLGTLASWPLMDTAWLASLILGPLQHLALAIQRLDNSNEYLDGVSRVTGEDYVISLFHLVVWIVGFIAVYSCSRREPVPKQSIIFIAGLWFIIGLVNVGLFAVRSV
ncbi:MAG TPA: hypothetical protein PKC67_04255 [Kiritimatiellia bacterium]|nr:hypothetical protein [Kiritimatiellia bacterium]HMP33541.1 hypothetical protein [Kiritimatiellia bacterium]